MQFYLSVKATPAFASTRCVSKVFLDMRHEGGRSSQKRGKVNFCGWMLGEIPSRPIVGRHGRTADISVRDMPSRNVGRSFTWAHLSYEMQHNTHHHLHPFQAEFQNLTLYFSVHIHHVAHQCNPYTKSIISNFKLGHVINMMSTSIKARLGAGCNPNVACRATALEANMRHVFKSGVRTLQN